MHKGYITITLQSKNDLTEFLKASHELFAGILQYSTDIESKVISGTVEPLKENESGVISKFWIDFLNGAQLNPTFAEKDDNAEDQNN